MTLLITLLSTFGSGLGSIFSWLVNLFQQEQAAKSQAQTEMNNDIAAHSGDGAISVSERDSVDAQDEDIQTQLKEIDAQQPAIPTPSPTTPKT